MKLSFSAARRPCGKFEARSIVSFPAIFLFLYREKAEPARRSLQDSCTRARTGAMPRLSRLNCAAIPASLLESELFGCEKGSYTGANGDRPGLVEIAGAGTLFLDEIGEMSWELQGKLLRLLQNGSYTRIGGHEERMGRVRVICATNIDLQEAVETGAFREDLFYRIDVVSLRLSALRDRRPISRSFASTFFRDVPRVSKEHTTAESSDAAPSEAVGLARKLARTGKLDCPGHYSRR